MFKQINVGDIVFLKSFVPKGQELRIKAVGIATGKYRDLNSSLGAAAIDVKWIWYDVINPIKLSPQDKLVSRSMTIYGEYSLDVIANVIAKFPTA